MGFHYSPNIITDGLVLYLDAANPKSYISGSTTWNDLSRGGYSGTLTNGPTYSSANNGSIVFDGVNDYVYKSTFTQGSDLSTLTISLWCNFSDTGSTGRYICSFGRDIGGSTGGMALFGYGFSAASSGQIIFELGSGFGRVSSGIIPTTNIWYNLLATADGTNTKFYVNGVLQNTSSQTTGKIASSAGYSIGSYLSPSIPPYPSLFFYNGRISNVQFYNRALSAQEVLQNYNTTKSRFGL